MIFSGSRIREIRGIRGLRKSKIENRNSKIPVSLTFLRFLLLRVASSSIRYQENCTQRRKGAKDW
jgi:hypothetical protein